MSDNITRRLDKLELSTLTTIRDCEGAEAFSWSAHSATQSQDDPRATRSAPISNTSLFGEFVYVLK